MHTIEPWYKWRDEYIASEDSRSPFYRRTYSEFYFDKQMYNYLIHPQWDEFGAEALFIKILYADYDESFAMIELLGEWNDAISNDILTLRKFVINRLMQEGIYKYVFIAENLLNFHADNEDYYEEWLEELREEDGWVAFINTNDHVADEMESARLQHYIHFGKQLNEVNWRRLKPTWLASAMEEIVLNSDRQLR